MSAENQHYAELASWFYDLTKPIGGDYPDVPYYAEQLSQKKHRILEIGAGTGRLCVPLIKEGFRVEALECSVPMISYLKKNLKAYKADTKIHTMRAEDMTFAAEFDTVIVSFGTFQLFSEFATAQRCLQNFKKALKKGGRLFIDLDIIRPELHKAGLKSHGVSLPLSKNEKILLEGSRTWDFLAQTENVHLRYELWQNSQLKSTELQDFSLRWYGQWEFEMLLKSAGFSKVEVLADYFDSEAHSDTQTLNFIATL